MPVRWWMLLMCCTGGLFATTGEHPRFVNLSQREGLSQGTINSICQDLTGFLWVATQDGLNRFDGYTFINYRHDRDRAESLGDSFVNTLLPDRSSGIWVGHASGLDHYRADLDAFEHILLPTYAGDVRPPVSCLALDASGELWIGTWGFGLFRLSPETGEIKAYPTKSKGLNDRIANLLIDEAGTLWLTLVGDGLAALDRATGEFSFYQQSPDQPKGLPNNFTVVLRQDQAGRFWLGSEAGLGMFQPRTGTYQAFPIRDANLKEQTGLTVIDILFPRAGQVWLATNRGLFTVDLEAGVARPIAIHPQSDNLQGNSFKVLFLDRAGILWVGSEFQGLFRHDLGERAFRHLVHEPLDANSLVHPCTFSVAEDRQGMVWFGSPNGLTRYDKRDGSFQRISQTQDGSPLGNVMALQFDASGLLWIGSNLSGLFTLDATGKFALVDGGKDGRGQVWSLALDNQNRIWVGGFNGLSLYSPGATEPQSWWPDPLQPTQLSHPDIRVLYPDKKGRLWVGTNGGGLNVTSLDKPGLFQRYVADANKPHQLCDNQILSMIEDDEGALWIGTPSGLNRFDGENFEWISHKDGLPNDFIGGILLDSRQRLWLSTYKGLACYDPKTKAIRLFDPKDGLLNYEFNYGTALLGADGAMYFGGISGVDSFYPNAISVNQVAPSVVITDLLLLNKRVGLQRDQPDSPLTVPISQTEELILSHKDYVFSLEFAALHFANPEKNRYAYKLEGVDKDWIETDAKRRFATYTRLNSGRYNFCVKAANKDGVWNEAGAQLVICIDPPFWLTWWAYVFYTVAFIAAIYLGMRLRLRGLKRHNAELARQVSERTSEVEQHGLLVLDQKAQLEAQNALLLAQTQEIERKASELAELSEVKSKFFADLSHEFRTPLTLSIGPLEDMLSGCYGPLDDAFRERMEMMLRNNRRLLDLVNQLLEVTKLEEGGMTLALREGDLVAFTEEYLGRFLPMAQRMSLALEFINVLGEVVTAFDPQKMHDILDNLLSNALKFTKPGGTITVKVWKQGGRCLLSVKDTGEGIPASRIGNLFERYYQGSGESAGFSASSGLGLALVKQLVQLHEGTVEVESNLGDGSEFVVSLPLRKAELALESSQKPVPGQTPAVPPAVDETPSLSGGSMKDVVLVIDDHDDIRSYLHGILAGRYEVLEAVNGEQGLEMARRMVPDLVISDVMMPKPDGFELCRLLKTDVKTSHIPVVLLTAKAAHDDKLQGLSGGADEYLVKPFNAREVQIRVENLIEGRRLLREKYSRVLKPMVPPQEDGQVASMDEVFLNKAVALVREHISEAHFGVAELAEEMALSRRQLLRKLSALTGLPPSDFVRNIRLQHAAMLLKARSGNVSEISMAVGFETPAHFSKLFKKAYGVLPSEYLDEEMLPV